MTNIICIKDGNNYQIDIEGHAEANPGGPDIVCSAISTLTYTLMSALENVYNTEKDIKVDYGDVHINISPELPAIQEIDTIVKTIMIGFAMLGEEYPNNVNVEW